MVRLVLVLLLSLVVVSASEGECSGQDCVSEDSALLGDTDAMISLTLAGLSYNDDYCVADQLAHNKSLNTLANWSLIWSATDEITLNKLILVRKASSGLYAIAIRGTVGGFTQCPEAWFEEWFREDFDVIKTPYPFLPQYSVTDGGARALETILNIKSSCGFGSFSGLNITGALAKVIAAKNLSELWITGHSLGGALTALLAPVLNLYFPSNIYASTTHLYTFAAPTYVDKNLASKIQQLFPSSVRFYNALDIAPNAYSSLSTINTIYYKYSISTPYWIQGIIDTLILYLYEASFTLGQITPSYVMYNPFKNGVSFYEEAGYQHALVTYCRLMNLTICPEVTANNCPSLTTLAEKHRIRADKRENFRGAVRGTTININIDEDSDIDTVINIHVGH